ncbi:MAG: sce7726 family protein [Prolixibacteraceae bacterium]|nr:sce7726 family protein [Prolixibacteraceae bacterium]
MPYSINQLRDFSSLFLRSEVLRWFNDDFESIELKLQRYRLKEKNLGNSYLNILKQIYKVLEKHYPNEYILKNEFLSQWLKEELGNRNSIIFNELRIGKAIADLAMFNGISQVFEIKTILDKEYRLSNQLKEYKKLFNEVYLIVSKEFLSKYIKFHRNIGIITYDSSSNNFELIQKSVFDSNIDVDVLMEVLHTREYLDIVRKYFDDIPEMNSFNQFNICKKLISKIPNKELNELFISKMKERNINNMFFNKVNREFNQICLSLNLKKMERDNLIKTLKTNKV